MCIISITPLPSSESVHQFLYFLLPYTNIPISGSSYTIFQCSLSKELQYRSLMTFNEFLWKERGTLKVSQYYFITDNVKQLLRKWVSSLLFVYATFQCCHHYSLANRIYISHLFCFIIIIKVKWNIQNLKKHILQIPFM